MKKKYQAYKTIGEVASILGLKDKKNNKLSTHTIRFWQSEFKQIKPKILFGNRRYFTEKDVEILILIKHLLKEKGMTIQGVKKILKNFKSGSLDEQVLNSVNNASDKSKILLKLKRITNLIKEMKDLKNG